MLILEPRINKLLSHFFGEKNYCVHRPVYLFNQKFHCCFIAENSVDISNMHSHHNFTFAAVAYGSG